MLGFLRRRKQSSLTVSAVELCGDGFCKVVGESHYQDPLRATLEICTETFEDRPSFTAVLVPEPDNPYDGNAIAVWSPRGKVGYLSRHTAPEYRRLFAEVRRRGYDGGACGAHLTGGEPGKPTIGVVLRLADAETCLEELDH
jgi:hypothetical protein